MEGYQALEAFSFAPTVRTQEWTRQRSRSSWKLRGQSLQFSCGTGEGLEEFALPVNTGTLVCFSLLH